MTDEFDLLRIDLVDALWKASGCNITLCTAPDCGHIEIERMMPRLGIEIDGQYTGGTRYQFRDIGSAYELSPDQYDALMMLTSLTEGGQVSKKDFFEGYMEVPYVVGDLLHEQGWRERFIDAANASPWAQEATRKEFLLELARAAFPGDYLDVVGPGGLGHRLLLGEDALSNLRETFEAASLIVPDVPSKFVRDLRVSEGDWGWQTKSPFSTMACYMLDIPALDNDVDQRSVVEVQLPLEYLKKERDDYWMCAERGHGILSNGLGIVAQFGGVFFAQQSTLGGVFSDSYNPEVSVHMGAYNKFIAPLEVYNSSPSVAVLFSEYRGYAAIFTSERRAILEKNDEESMAMWVYPAGWGIAAVQTFDNQPEFFDRLRDLVELNYSPQLTAAAQYLLEVVQVRDW